ncbi:Zinc transporter [Fasciolopsis buskii]|uniref:Zinc transporter ZIP11 n=1 Tax=Fasciolopsis buskii TaxID=27845 RepID=A0A8E0RQ45_9TREM|nr:Zinc transporter [Fasciolopsis buski]
MLRHHSPLVQTLLGTGLTWGVTALGAAFCAFQPTHAHKQVLVNDELRGGDRSSPDFGLRLRKPPRSPSTTVNLPVTNHNPRYMTRRLWLLMIAVTVHNIPEGFAVGVAFGGIGKYKRYTFTDARNLAIGIAIQNFPEGLSVSLPLRAAGYSFYKSLWYGQLSGLVEPLAGVIGCVAVQFVRKFQPYALGFAAGAMLFVVFDDVIPEAQSR